MSHVPIMCSEKENMGDGNKKTTSESEFIRIMLTQENIQNYEPDVVTHLADFTNNYISQIIENALVFMKLTDRKSIETSDIKLALEVMGKRANSSKRLPFQKLMALAKTHNKSKVFQNCEFNGLPLPPELLNKNNYKMRTINNLKHGTTAFSSPKTAITNWQTPNFDNKKQSKMQINVPQKIVIKPQFQTPNSVYFKQIRMEIDS